MLPFAIISPTFTYPDGTLLGHLETVHKTIDTARKAMMKRDRAMRRNISTRGCHVASKFAIVAVEWTDGEKARGKRIPS